MTKVSPLPTSKINCKSYSGQISYVKELKEKYFDQKKIKFLKQYFAFDSKDGKYQCTITIPQSDVPMQFPGEWTLNKSSAENSAAKAAVKHLKLM